MILAAHNAGASIDSVGPEGPPPPRDYADFGWPGVCLALLGAIALLAVSGFAYRFVDDTVAVAPGIAGLLLLTWGIAQVCLVRRLHVDPASRTFILKTGTIFHPRQLQGELGKESCGLIILRRTSRTELGNLETYEIHMVFPATNQKIRLEAFGTYAEALQCLRVLSLEFHVPEVEQTTDGIIPRRSRRQSLKRTRNVDREVTRSLPADQPWSRRVKIEYDGGRLTVTVPAGVSHADLGQLIIVIGLSIVSMSLGVVFFRDAHEWNMAIRALIGVTALFFSILTAAMALCSWLAIRLRQHRIELTQDRMRITTVTAGIWRRKGERAMWDLIHDIYPGFVDANGKLATVVVTDEGYVTCGDGLPPDGKRWLADVLFQMWRMHASVF